METYQPRNLLQPNEKNFKRRFEWNKFDPGGNIYLTELKAGKPYESRMLLVYGGLFEDEGYTLSATTKTSFKNQVRDWLDYNEVFNRKFCKSKAREKVGFVLSRKIDKILESHFKEDGDIGEWYNELDNTIRALRFSGKEFLEDYILGAKQRIPPKIYENIAGFFLKHNKPMNIGL